MAHHQETPRPEVVVTRCDVLVIGGGAAGLTAAERLAPHCKVIVLEARDRLGGRIWTTEPWGNQGLPVDLGAEFIHVPEVSPRFSLVLRPEHTPAFSRRGLYHFDGKRINQNLNRWVRRAVAETWYCDLKGRPGSVENAIRVWPSREAQKIVRAEVEALYAADASRLKASVVHGHWRDWGDVGDDYRPRGGFQCLVKNLEKGLEGRDIIRKSDPVTTIDWRAGRVRVTTNAKKRYESRLAIVSVPLGILQSGGLKLFNPALPARKQSSINGIGMGDVVKIAVRSERFWDPFQYVSSDREIPMWWSWPQSRNGCGVLIGWAAGPAASKLVKCSDDEIKCRARRVLQELFVKKQSVICAIPSKDIVVTNWSQDPFSKGAYSYDRLTGDSSLREELARPENDTIFFAGEATEPLYHATVHGAIRSGDAAADRVLDRLRWKPSEQRNAQR
jgi:monoamine oxidase